MPPWHIDKAVGVQKFKNDISLTDDQINTIVRWVDSGAPLGDLKDMPARQAVAGAGNEWKAAKELGQPDLVIKSDPYTMAAHHQDVFWWPTVPIPAHRAALGACGRDAARDRSQAAGSLITQSPILAQDDPEAFGPGGDPVWAGAAC